jgi:hypothetical protein
MHDPVEAVRSVAAGFSLRGTASAGFSLRGTASAGFSLRLQKKADTNNRSMDETQ